MLASGLPHLLPLSHVHPLSCRAPFAPSLVFLWQRFASAAVCFALVVASVSACAKSPSTQYWKATASSDTLVQNFNIVVPDDFYSWTGEEGGSLGKMVGQGRGGS